MTPELLMQLPDNAGISVKELAKLLGTTEAAIHQRASVGDLPPHRLQKYIRGGGWKVYYKAFWKAEQIKQYWRAQCKTK